MKKVNAIYFEELKFHKQNLSLIKKKFNVLILKNPSFLNASHFKNVEVLFTPFSLKVNKILIKKCEKLKVVISNTTSIPHIDENSCKKSDIYPLAVCILEVWCGGIWNRILLLSQFVFQMSNG